MMHPIPSVPAPTCSDPALAGIAARALAGERLTLDDGADCYATEDLWGLCRIADEISKRLHGDRAYYNVNRHLNYSNVCALSCKFCEFFRKAGDEGAYEYSIEQIRNEAINAQTTGATEIHIVGGLHPTLPFSYYTDMLSAIRSSAPGLHIKAFTAVEIVHFARISRRFQQRDPASGIRQVLEELKTAGLGSLPGGGAEVFDDRVHDDAFKGKIRSDVWLTVHRVAHELGLNTNATILYGHIEQRTDRLVHMDMLRTAQDDALRSMGYAPDPAGAITLTGADARLPKPNDTHGFFQAIIPLPFIPDGSDLEALPGPSGLENLRTIAVARLMLDNFPNVKAFWIMQTLPLAELMLQAGANDIDGTVVWYDITKVGHASTHQETTSRDLENAIRNAGLRPVERDTRYCPVIRDGARWRLADSPA